MAVLTQDGRIPAAGRVERLDLLVTRFADPDQPGSPAGPQPG
ncbi:hypothetical protein POF50_027080 [Streptomyces sp. SL13]|uniref:Uncharacterized protein n=1 Tax=Streptantibioticus silvisoli TaxID=2705255 RepID=A0AA90H6S0_9ACTN|nr:hypothetical protein [Streptantibioticus silvisoli]MDI5972966.1 hypothetical protein [Streptantibioticus silvisoli]